MTLIALVLLGIALANGMENRLRRRTVATALNLAEDGAITGGVMVWLLRQPAAKDLGASQAAE